MMSQHSKHVGSQFNRGNWSRPRFFRGYRRRAFFYARPGSRRWSGQHQPTAEQLALRSTAAEVAQLFVMAARSAHGNAEKQGQLQAFLERSRAELRDFVQQSSQRPQQASAENAQQIEQA